MSGLDWLLVHLARVNVADQERLNALLAGGHGFGQMDLYLILTNFMTGLALNRNQMKGVHTFIDLVGEEMNAELDTGSYAKLVG